MMWFFGNSDLMVATSTILFIALLWYLGVHNMILKMLDDRADRIRHELDDARKLREEAQTLLASYEKKQKEVEAQAAEIVASAKTEAERAAVQAKADLASSIERRLKTAEDQIAAAEGAAVRQVRDQAIQAATAAAAAVIAQRMTPEAGDGMIDAAIAEAGGKLH